MICVTVPVMVTAAVPLFVTTAPLVPAVTVRVPSPTDRVTVIEPAPASTSLIESPVFFSVSAVCSVAA